MEYATTPSSNKAGEGDENKNLDLLRFSGGDFVPAGLYQGASHG
jgi:hypothetical protein